MKKYVRASQNMSLGEYSKYYDFYSKNAAMSKLDPKRFGLPSPNHFRCPPRFKESSLTFLGWAVLKDEYAGLLKYDHHYEKLAVAKNPDTGNILIVDPFDYYGIRVVPIDVIRKWLIHYGADIEDTKDAEDIDDDYVSLGEYGNYFYFATPEEAAREAGDDVELYREPGAFSHYGDLTFKGWAIASDEYRDELDDYGGWGCLAVAEESSGAITLVSISGGRLYDVTVDEIENILFGESNLDEE